MLQVLLILPVTSKAEGYAFHLRVQKRAELPALPNHGDTITLSTGGSSEQVDYCALSVNSDLVVVQLKPVITNSLQILQEIQELASQEHWEGWSVQI